MSIKGIKENDLPRMSWGPAYTVSDETPDRFFGKLCEVIEAMGVSEKQEQATKSLIRKTIWDIFNNDAVYISTDTHNKIREEWMKRKENNDLSPIK